MTKKIKTPFFAEIIESSLYDWKAVSWKWDFSPAFGSLVTLESDGRTSFGIVYQSATGSQDHARQPFPYQKTTAELLAEQPQIFNFLQTTFSCVTVGFSEHHGIIMYQLAPEPPKIHTFVQYATIEQARIFFSKPLYLSVLFQANIAHLDELLLAIMWNQHKMGLLTEEKVTASIEQLSLLTGNDYRRVKLLLQRLEAHNLIH